MQFRRLDPLANAGPWQRAMKQPVKSFTITQDQFKRVEERRPQLIVVDGEFTVVGRPYRDFLEVHYAFPDVQDFGDHFNAVFDRCTRASNKQEAPRGAIIHFRDRPNRPLAETMFWESALVEGGHWVEMDYLTVPEQDEPGDTIEGGFQVRDATQADRDTISRLEAEVAGLPPLTSGGVDSLYDESRWLKLITTASGVPVGCVALRTEGQGWGIIEEIFLLQAVRDQLRAPLLRWVIAFLRNNGGRRQRRRAYLADTEEVALLREVGFSAGETGVDYSRPVDPADVERQ
ncbi:MAG TPA: hypothetical protein VG845_12400, partial [Dehalococcoidia bacterium]|nr:hypothetical protein [Dehalococcoidia bacterium]